MKELRNNVQPIKSKIMNKMMAFFNGRFGKKVLKAEYRELWVKMWVCVGVIVFVALFFMAIQFMTWLSNLINYCAR